MTYLRISLIRKYFSPNVVLAGYRVTTSTKIRKTFSKERKMEKWKKVIYLRIG